MSDAPTPAPPTPPRRHPILSVLMVIAGLILLLPGVCALVFSPMAATDPSLLGLILICFAISAGGVMLIVGAVRGPKPPRSHDFDGGPGNPDGRGGYR